MTPSLDPRTAARILDLAESRGARSGALAGFAAILLIAAHAALSDGSPRSAHAAVMFPAAAEIHARESAQMKQLMAIGVAAAISASTSAQDAVQWRVEDGGNGHWYRAYFGVGGCWTEHRQAAQQLGGHLATITSGTEDAFIEAMSTAEFLNLGGLQAPDACEPGCGWMWVTGEPWSYTRWDTDQPEDFYGGQNGGQDYLARTTTGWHDASECQPYTGSGYVIEWSADCNSDGIVDFGQIRSGEFADANANNIPDCCESGSPCECAGDTNHDNSIDGIDLATILTRWGQPAAKFPEADCNRDGVIDGSDLAIVLGSWGACP